MVVRFELKSRQQVCSHVFIILMVIISLFKVVSSSLSLEVSPSSNWFLISGSEASFTFNSTQEVKKDTVFVFTPADPAAIEVKGICTGTSNEKEPSEVELEWKYHSTKGYYVFTAVNDLPSFSCTFPVKLTYLSKHGGDFSSRSKYSALLTSADQEPVSVFWDDYIQYGSVEITHDPKLSYEVVDSSVDPNIITTRGNKTEHHSYHLQFNVTVGSGGIIAGQSIMFFELSGSPEDNLGDFSQNTIILEEHDEEEENDNEDGDKDEDSKDNNEENIVYNEISEVLGEPSLLFVNASISDLTPIFTTSDCVTDNGDVVGHIKGQSGVSDLDKPFLISSMYELVFLDNTFTNSTTNIVCKGTILVKKGAPTQDEVSTGVTSLKLSTLSLYNGHINHLRYFDISRSRLPFATVDGVGYIANKDEDRICLTTEAIEEGDVCDRSINADLSYDRYGDHQVTLEYNLIPSTIDDDEEGEGEGEGGNPDDSDNTDDSTNPPNTADLITLATNTRKIYSHQLTKVITNNVSGDKDAEDKEGDNGGNGTDNEDDDLPSYTISTANATAPVQLLSSEGLNEYIVSEEGLTQVNERLAVLQVDFTSEKLVDKIKIDEALLNFKFSGSKLSVFATVLNNTSSETEKSTENDENEENEDISKEIEYDLHLYDSGIYVAPQYTEDITKSSLPIKIILELSSFVDIPDFDLEFHYFNDNSTNSGNSTEPNDTNEPSAFKTLSEDDKDGEGSGEGGSDGDDDGESIPSPPSFTVISTPFVKGSVVVVDIPSDWTRASGITHSLVHSQTMNDREISIHMADVWSSYHLAGKTNNTPEKKENQDICKNLNNQAMSNIFGWSTLGSRINSIIEPNSENEIYGYFTNSMPTIGTLSVSAKLAKNEQNNVYLGYNRVEASSYLYNQDMSRFTMEIVNRTDSEPTPDPSPKIVVNNEDFTLTEDTDTDTEEDIQSLKFFIRVNYLAKLVVDYSNIPYKFKSCDKQVILSPNSNYTAITCPSTDCKVKNTDTSFELEIVGYQERIFSDVEVTCHFTPLSLSADSPLYSGVLKASLLSETLAGSKNSPMILSVNNVTGTIEEENTPEPDEFNEGADSNKEDDQEGSKTENTNEVRIKKAFEGATTSTHPVVTSHLILSNSDSSSLDHESMSKFLSKYKSMIGQYTGVTESEVYVDKKKVSVNKNSCYDLTIDLSLVNEYGISSDTLKKMHDNFLKLALSNENLDKDVDICSLLENNGKTSKMEYLTFGISAKKQPKNNSSAWSLASPSTESTRPKSCLDKCGKECRPCIYKEKCFADDECLSLHCDQEAQICEVNGDFNSEKKCKTSNSATYNDPLTVSTTTVLIAIIGAVLALYH